MTHPLTSHRLTLASAFGRSLAFTLALGSASLATSAQIDQSNWGTVTAPVFGQPEPNPHYQSSAAFPGVIDLFAGPGQYYDSATNSFKFKFADNNYYHGVLPNGRIVNPAGQSVQVGMNPLGMALTPDGAYLITSNDDERDEGFASLQNPINKGGYGLTVIRASDMKVLAHVAAGRVFIGLQIKGASGGPYTLYVSGGADQNVKLFTLSGDGTTITPGPIIPISPITPQNKGFVSNYTPAPGFPTNATPTGFSPTGAKITFPAGSALSPDGQYLYVACNGDNSLAVIDTTTNQVIKQLAVGYFPYSVSVSHDGSRVLVSNWGVTEYKFSNPTYDANGQLTRADSEGNVAGFFVPVTDTSGKTSSVSIINIPGGDPTQATLLRSVSHGHRLDALNQVGDTHPSATAILQKSSNTPSAKGRIEILYTARSNSDSLGMTFLGSGPFLSLSGLKLKDFDLSPVALKTTVGTKAGTHTVHGAYPNAIVVSPDNTRVYVAEAGLNSVAVLDTTEPQTPKLIGRIPTGWYPTALTLDAAGTTLYVCNAKGVGEDINADILNMNSPGASGVESYTDSNFLFGSVQKIDLRSYPFNDSNTQVLANNYTVQPASSLETSIVPLGIPKGARPGSAQAGSAKIKHVIFILHENKSFDSMLGNQSHFGPFASLTYNNTGTMTMPNGTAMTSVQNTGVALNTQLLARSFASAVNYYSDSEESDAGHQFAASGTATDYTEKTLLVKTGRGLLVNKNFEPEDYPEGGYIFNNAARNGVSFKDYGALVRIVGTDTGTSKPTTLNDPQSGFAGYPQLNGRNVTHPLVNKGDVADPAVTGPNANPFDPNPQPSTPRLQGLGQSYFLNLPILKILGDRNANGEPHLDRNYAGYNFNISDQRRAKEFIQDFDRMVKTNKLPRFLYIYQPNDHTGSVQAPNASKVGTTGLQQIADGDVGLGMVVQHIMNSPLYYNSADGTGSAIFITYDDAQSSLDHIHPHRTPLVVVSPYARVTKNGALDSGYVGTHHYVTASVVKTEELLLGLPPNNLGDLFATDLRDLFQSSYNGITAGMFTGENSFQRIVTYAPSPEGKRIWALASKLDNSGPDRDSRRFGQLTRLSGKADELHTMAVKRHHLQSQQYIATQEALYTQACKLVNAPAPRDDDD